MKKLFFLPVVLLLLSLMAGCQTAAQRQAILIRENSQITAQKAIACVQKITTNPAYQNIAKHQPLNGMVNPTLEQLDDSGLPNDEEINEIISFHNEMELCRLQIINDYMKFLPGIIPATVELYHKIDLINADLIQRKIIWGEANKAKLILKDEYRAKVQAFNAQLSRDLAASHNAELTRRQAALNALNQWAYQQQVLMQNQEMINSLNRLNTPRMTHCTMVPDANGNLIGSCQ